MKVINRTEWINEYMYHRSSSYEYWKYLEFLWIKIIEIGKQYGWMKHIFWGLFQIVKYERIDEEPNVEDLRKKWFKRWMLIWVPKLTTNIPKWWKKMWINFEFTLTWFSVIEDENYYKKWKTRGKRARKKYLENPALSIQQVNEEIFQKYYKELKIKQVLKRNFIEYHHNISQIDKRWVIRNFICFYDDEAIAWLSVLDYNETSSVHLVSFITKKWKQYQAGTGLIDYWFNDSLKKWIKYINFDHLRDKYMSFDQKWYSDFKENFMDYKISFKDAYFKFI